jgi:hypothetical protein
MSWRASAYVKSELLASRVTKSEKMLLYALAENYGEETRYASPNISHLAVWSLMSERQARRCLTALTDPERKILYIVGSRVGGRGKSTKYGFVELQAPDEKGDRVAPFRAPEEHLSAEKEDRASTETGTGQVEKEDIAVSPEPYNRKYEPYNRKNEPEELTGSLARWAETIENAARQARKDGRVVLAEELVKTCAELKAIGARVQKGANGDLEVTESNLRALDEKLFASLERATPAEALAQLRAQVDRDVIPHRRKMPAPEVDLFERRSLKNLLFEQYKIPHLSLFHL